MFVCGISVVLVVLSEGFLSTLVHAFFICTNVCEGVSRDTPIR